MKELWFPRTALLLALFLIAGAGAGAARAADTAARMADQEPPGSIAEPIRKMIQPRAVEVVEGGAPVFRFWFVSEVPLKAKPASPDKALDNIAETTLVGAVTVGSGRRDYKDNEIAAGDYTVRFALQPQDGDHLGTSDSPYFLLLIPAAADTKPDGFASTKAMAKVSGKDTASSHPMVLNLRAASSDAGPFPKLSAPAPDHQSVRVQVPARAGADKASVTFEIVVKGHGHIQ